MSKTITVTADVQMPRVPAFLKYGGGTLDIADVDDKSLKELAAAWTNELLDSAKKRRAERSTTGDERE